MTSHPNMRSRRDVLATAASALVVAALPVRAATTPLIKVWKDPNCGCCGAWVAHLKRNGFETRVTETTDMRAIKQQFGVPSALGSCHTAEVEGYVIEGHVPASAILRLLRERPTGKGLSVPGMPIGSPGMEGGTPETYDVVLFNGQQTSVFARFKGDRPI
jgi:hypothetical protein